MSLPTPSFRIIRKANGTGGFDYFLYSEIVFGTTKYRSNGYTYNNVPDANGNYTVTFHIKDDAPEIAVQTNVNQTIALGADIFTSSTGTIPQINTSIQDNNGGNTDPIVVTIEHVEEEDKPIDLMG